MFEDLEKLPGTVSAEIIGGAIVEKSASSFEHSAAQSGFDTELSRRFRRRGGDGGKPGGWWIGTEAEVQYGPHDVFRHDLAGWRRDRVPARPSGRPVRERPDWVCEILSPTNAKSDLVDKMRVLHRSAVPHYWVVDPIAKVLTIYRHAAAGYLALLATGPDEPFRGEPFESVELQLSVLLGDEDPDD